MLSLGQSCSWSLRWDENRGILGWERRQISLLRLEGHKDCSLAAMVTGGGAGTPRWPLGPGAAGLVLSEPRLSRGSSQGTVLVSALPAFLLLPEPSCAPGPTLAGLRLLASHLVPFPRLWSLSLQDGTYPGKQG